MNHVYRALSLHKNSALPLYLQIYHQLRGAILDGRLSAGEKLASERQMSQTWGVARETVNEALALLGEEGFVETRTGAGTFVVASICTDWMMKRQNGTAAPPMTNWGGTVAKRAEAQPGRAAARPPIDFGFGRSYPHVFPYDIWRRMLGRYLSTDDVMLSRYGSVAGFMPLRKAIADYVQRHRGVVCEPRQVVIVNGAQQALDLLSRMFLRKEDAVIMESPGYIDAYDLFRAHGATVIPVPVDNRGLPVERLPESPIPKLIFTTPSNQFPKGGTLSASRRLQLLKYADQKNAYIIEDDYDGPLRYEGHPLSALQGLDPNQRVIYLGTFSKVLFPALRLAYVILPDALLASFIHIKRLIDRGSPTLTQAAVADFMVEGHFVRHLRRLRTQYGGVRSDLVSAVSAQLGKFVQFVEEPAGLHLMLYLDASLDEAEVIAKAAAAGVRLTAGAPFHFHQPAPPSILLGFSQLSSDEMTQGIAILKEILADGAARTAQPPSRR